MPVAHEDGPLPVDRRDAPAPAVFTWRKGLALLIAAGVLWLLSVTATTIVLDLVGRP